MRNIPVELVTRYEEAGWWTRETLGQVLAGGLHAAPDAEFRVYSAVRPWSGTFHDVEHVARRLAAGLRARGVGAGDVVAFQLPNWMEAAATFWASAFLGAVLVPIVHFYGRKELAHILASAKPRVFITAEEFGRMTYQPDLCSDIPVVGRVGRDFDELLADEPMAGTIPADPAGPALIAFTSGTTSAPKGVVHSHRSLVFEARQLSGQIRSIGDSQLIATPVGHFIGMLGALLIPVLNGRSVYLIDDWDPAEVLALMDRDGLTLGGGPPYFVTSLLDHPDCTPAHRAQIKSLGLGGSTVPAAVTRRLSDLGIIVFRSYGSSEHPSITGSTLDAPEDKRVLTDGNPMPGGEIRLAADGEILSRGPDLCLGYTDDALPRPPSTTTAGITPATSACWMPTATSLSPTAKPTSSSAAARTSAPWRSKRCCSGCPASPRRWWWRPLMPGSANEARRRCGSSPGIPCPASTTFVRTSPSTE